MPGSSLWLLPPSDSPLNHPLTSLIEATSVSLKSSHRFIAHITLTSEILPSKYSSDPQAWLDSLDLLSGKDVRVDFEKLASEDVFFRKCYIQCEKTDGLKKLAEKCRSKVEGFEDESSAKKWSNEDYNPHLSLAYHDCPILEAEGLMNIATLAQRVRVEIPGGESGARGGWIGGKVVLVPTDKPIDQWVPIAERVL